MPKIGKYAMSKSNLARAYIKENFFKLNKREILKHLVEKTGLKYKSLEMYYCEIKDELEAIVNIEVKNSMRREKEFTHYKGTPRQFFRFDDRNLYKGLIKNNPYRRRSR